MFGVFICFLAESIYDLEIELKISNEDSWSLYLFLIILRQKTNEDSSTSEIESMRRKKKPLNFLQDLDKKKYALLSEASSIGIHSPAVKGEVGSFRTSRRYQATTRLIQYGGSSRWS